MFENHTTNLDFARLCRCCATERNLMYDIFCGTCTNAQTYREVVMECARVQLFRDDGMPSLICHECVSILDTFVVFRRKCIETESILKQMRNNTSTDEREKLEEPNDIKTELDLEENSVIEIRPEMTHVGIEIEDTAVDENRADTSSPYPEIDRRSTENVRDVKEDDRHVEPEKPHLDTDRTERRAFDYPCDLCEKSFGFKLILDEHRTIHADVEPVTDDRPYSCDVCKKSFTTKAYRNKHQKKHTDENPYVCGVCDETFERRSRLDDHETTHTGEREYACGLCEKTFRFGSHLVQHRRAHADEKPYSCVDCGKRFPREHMLTLHRRTHADEKPHVCDRCAKAFHFKAHLFKHQKSHVRKHDVQKQHVKRQHVKRHVPVQVGSRSTPADARARETVDLQRA